MSLRSAAVNKDRLTQCQTLVALRTTSPQDRKAILAWVDYHAVAKELVDSLPELENGEAWVCSPQFLKFMKRVHFDRRRTFDSGATPLVGASRSVATLADIDLGDLRGQMSAVVERAAQDDPKLLRRRIDELERELRSMGVTDRGPPERIEVPVEVRVDVPHLPSIEALSALASTAGELVAGLSDLQKAIVGGETTEARDISHTLPPQPTPRSPADQRMRVGVTEQPARHIARPSTAETAGRAAGLGKAERSILSVLAQFVYGRTKRQLAMQAGYSAKGGGFGNALGRLRAPTSVPAT